MCERWLVFKNFLNDMGKRPTPGHSVERTDNDKGYSPENCIWGTARQQGQNKRSVRNYTIGGVTKCLSEWVRTYNVKYSLVHKRLTDGWSVEMALKTPATRPKVFTVDGTTGTIADLCIIFGMKYITVYTRVKRGIPIDVALKAKGVRI